MHPRLRKQIRLNVGVPLELTGGAEKSYYEAARGIGFFFFFFSRQPRDAERGAKWKQER